MNELRWSEQADGDVDHILSWYGEHDIDRVQTLVDIIASAPLRLLDHPLLGPEIGGSGVRKWPIKGTPFLLLYTIAKHQLVIVRVVHAASDWKSVV